ncbi:uncharacterized protein LOC132718370 [Ruditapes philippinarum]|uniref:uncharacterized protein LOC132718370 n=1 Tax=Ruditapes philippinarum TaxID=129788 RepID=UPI00295AB4BE|nr:uncharacterized protein LOC132718370 [Ruditapes philippinarum]
MKTYQHLMEETIVLNVTQNSDEESVFVVQENCFISPKREQQTQTNDKVEQGFYIITKNVVSGQTSAMSEHDDSAFKSSNNVEYFLQRIMMKKQPKVVPWVLIDLAASISVSGLQIPFQKDLSPQIECFISHEKWAFLYFAALSCLHKLNYQSQSGYINTRFQREIEGRYIALVGAKNDNEDTFFHMDDIAPFRVVTQRLYQDDGRCNMYLGMSDGSITGGQILVSSQQQHYPASGIRPYRQGWCASVNDTKPTVTVDLLDSLQVEGLIVWNWKEKLQEQTTVIERLYLLGVRHFVIYHGDELYNLTKYNVDFHFDNARAYDEEQSFLFKTRVKARFIQIRILEPFYEGLNCIRFELLGCPSSGLFRNPILQTFTPQKSVVTVVQTITAETIINNIGNHVYKAGQTYCWIVRFTNFVKVILTHLSLNEYKEQLCRDSIYLSSNIGGNKQSVRTIDNTLNGIKVGIETSTRQLVITFDTCLATSMQLKQGSGFQAILSSQDTPACFQLDSEVEWNNGRRENCKEPSMTITSMSFLGLPFRETTEIWTIHVPFKIIHFHIIEFQVACNEHGSKFTIKDAMDVNTYCNVKRPPNFIFSASDTLIVSFYKATDPHMMYTEGFRASYDTSTVSVDEHIDYETPRSELRNVAIGRPSIMSSFYLLPASLSNDGVIHPDSWSWTCSNTDLEFEPWWMIDLEDIYKLNRVIVNNRRDCVGCALRTENVEVSVGLTMSSMIVTGYHCGILKTTKIFPQFGAKARYVKVQLKNVKRYMNLCEVEVYGILDITSDHHNTNKFSAPEPVHGNWGIWGEWSEVCTPNKQQRRKRHCNNPSPNFRGNFCQGNDTSYRKCSSSHKFQENILIDKHMTSSGKNNSTNTSCYITSFEDYPWIQIDLFDQYHMHELTIDNNIEVTNLAILCGKTTCTMEEEYYTKCGGILTNVLDLTGITARFIKLQVMQEFTSLRVCGLKLSGQLGKY